MKTKILISILIIIGCIFFMPNVKAKSVTYSNIIVALADENGNISADNNENYGLYCLYENTDFTINIDPEGNKNYSGFGDCDTNTLSLKGIGTKCPGVIYEITTIVTSIGGSTSCTYSTKDLGFYLTLPDMEAPHMTSEAHFLVAVKVSDSYEPTPSENGFCGVLDEETVGYIWKIYYVLLIVGIVATVVLGILDFVGAAASSDKDNLKKAWKKFMRRFITLAVLFLLPYVIELIFKIVPPIKGMNQDNPLCRIGR